MSIHICSLGGVYFIVLLHFTRRDPTACDGVLCSMVVLHSTDDMKTKWWNLCIQRLRSAVYAI
jgi:hypothetical protein